MRKMIKLTAQIETLIPADDPMIWGLEPGATPEEQAALARGLYVDQRDGGLTGDGIEAVIFAMQDDLDVGEQATVTASVELVEVDDDRVE